MGNRRLYTTRGSYLVPARFPAPMAAARGPLQSAYIKFRLGALLFP
jgi:hypothetical protein